MSDSTKKIRLKSRITFWLSVALNVLPMAIFALVGFANGTTTQKVTIGFTGLLAIILGLIMVITKLKIGRSIFWILFFAIYIVAKQSDLIPLIVAMGLCTIIDDLIVTPLHKRFSTDYHTNKQIDKRLENVPGKD